MALEHERTKKLLEQDDIWLDLEKANHAIDWIETFVILYEGAFAGKPMVLNLWQKAFLTSVFGLMTKSPVDKYDADQNFIGTEMEERRLTQRAYLIVGSGNGKTALSSAIAMYVMFGLGISAPRAFVYSATYAQAKYCYTNIASAIRQQPLLLKESQLRNSVAEVYIPRSGGELNTMSSNADNIQGIKPAFTIGDELHTFNTGKIVDDILKNENKMAMLNIDMLSFLISTDGTKRGKYFDELKDELRGYLTNHNSGFHDRYRIWYFCNESEEELYENFENVQKSNPQYPMYMKKSALEQALQEALSSKRASVSIYSQNFNIPQTSSQVFFTAEECDIPEFDEEKIRGTSGWFGLDMSYTTDLTCLTYLTELRDSEGKMHQYVKQWYFKPNDLMEEHSENDKVDYRLLEEKGYLETVQGDSINQVDILKRIYEIVDEYEIRILKLGIDPNRADYILSELRNFGGKEYAYAISNQMTRILTPVIYRIKRDFGRHNISCNNKILPMHMSATEATIKDDDTIILDKVNQRHRIDGIHSLVYATKAKDYWLREQGYDVEEYYYEEKEDKE